MMSHSPKSQPCSETIEFRHEGIDIVLGEGILKDSVDRLVRVCGARPLVISGASATSNAAFVHSTRALDSIRGASRFVKHGSAKDPEVVRDGLQAFWEADSTGVIAIGGGDALDLGKQISHYASNPSAFGESFPGIDPAVVPPGVENGMFELAVVPAEVAGAGLSPWASSVFSARGSATSTTRAVRGNLRTAIYDLKVFESVPVHLLCQSFFNGLNKGIETLYAPRLDPSREATALRGVRLMVEGHVGLISEPPNLDLDLLRGAVLIQLTPRLSIIHALCHGLSRIARIPQGPAHAVVAPVALEWLLPKLSVRQSRMLEIALAESSETSEMSALEQLLQVRDNLGQPQRLRELGLAGISDDVISYVLKDKFLDPRNTDIAVTADDVRSILCAAL